MVTTKRDDTCTPHVLACTRTKSHHGKDAGRSRNVLLPHTSVGNLLPLIINVTKQGTLRTSSLCTAGLLLRERAEKITLKCLSYMHKITSHVSSSTKTRRKPARSRSPQKLPDLLEQHVSIANTRKTSLALPMCVPTYLGFVNVRKSRHHIPLLYPSPTEVPP